MYTAKDTLRLAKRYNNTKRSYLLVNPLQAKHIPVSPTESLNMMNALGKKLFEKYPVVQILLGGIAGVILRYFAHVVSGIFVFGSGDPENYGAVAWSFLYNSFAFGDMAIALAAGCALFASKNFLRMLNSAAAGRRNLPSDNEASSADTTVSASEEEVKN